MADVDARTVGSATPTAGPDAAPVGEAPRVAAGSVLFALGMLVWASGNLLYDDTAVGAWVLFIAGGVGASFGLRLAVGDIPGAPGRPRIEALEEAERNGRTSMDEGPSLQSLPDLDDLPALVQSFTGTGQQVDVVGEIHTERPSRLASVTMYRLAQEGLTNAVRYGTGPIDVSVDVTDSHVALEIINEVSGALHESGGGVGLAAASARVSSIGGTFEAGPIGDERWRLSARIPA